jgi:hypothetical protein
MQKPYSKFKVFTIRIVFHVLVDSAAMKRQVCGVLGDLIIGGGAKDGG